MGQISGVIITHCFLVAIIGCFPSLIFHSVIFFVARPISFLLLNFDFKAQYVPGFLSLVVLFFFFGKRLDYSSFV